VKSDPRGRLGAAHAAAAVPPVREDEAGAAPADGAVQVVDAADKVAVAVDLAAAARVVPVARAKEKDATVDAVMVAAATAEPSSSRTSLRSTA
jgi:hypothetical protein